MSDLEASAEFAQRAFISLFDKEGLVPIATELTGHDWELSSSGGTADRLRENGLQVTDVETITGWPDMFDGRVKTLHPMIHGGLLADLHNPVHVATMQQHGIKPIHLLWGNLYPFEKAVADPNATDASIMENIDIGGSALMRAAVKGGRLVLTHPEQNDEFLDRLHNNALDDPAYVRELAARAFYESARYESLIMSYLGGTSFVAFVAKQHVPVKYGENPFMTPAALYADNRIDVDPLGLDQFKHIKGWEQSFINTTDMDSSLQSLTHIAAGFEKNFGNVPPMAIGVKHGNACGAGVAETQVEAVKKMLEGDTKAIFGGVVMINGIIDKEVAEALMHHAMEKPDAARILDGVVGAGVTDEALEILSRKKLRVVINPALANLSGASLDTSRRLRPVRGGALAQPNYTFIMDLNAEHMEYHGELSDQQKEDLILAWAIGSTNSSNTNTIVKDGKLLGNGVGQQDRVGAAMLALLRTTTRFPRLRRFRDRITISQRLDKDKLEGAVVYSDSFYPFEDGPSLLARAGIAAILTSSGSVRDPHVIKKLRRAGVSVALIPDKLGRGFAKH